MTCTPTRTGNLTAANIVVQFGPRPRTNAIFHVLSVARRFRTALDFETNLFPSVVRTYGRSSSKTLHPKFETGAPTVDSIERFRVHFCEIRGAAKTNLRTEYFVGKNFPTVQQHVS